MITWKYTTFISTGRGLGKVGSLNPRKSQNRNTNSVYCNSMAYGTDEDDLTVSYNINFWKKYLILV